MKDDYYFKNKNQAYVSRLRRDRNKTSRADAQVHYTNVTFLILSSNAKHLCGKSYFFSFSKLQKKMKKKGIKLFDVY